MKIFSTNRLNLQNEMNNMEKKIYSRPRISMTSLDSDINLVLMSPPTPSYGMSLDESNETNGEQISQFINPLKWFR